MYYKRFVVLLVLDIVNYEQCFYLRIIKESVDQRVLTWFGHVDGMD